MIYKNEICCSLVVASSYDELANIRDFIHYHAIEFGFSIEITQKIVLAVDEACTNLIKYGYCQDDNQTIKIFIEYDKNAFIIKIMDTSESFNPKDRPDTDVKTYIRQMLKGGLGIQIIKLVIDEIDYIPANIDNNENVLILKKFL
jgi:anti-sigma regulatory factor (Ser/Thr protein kinase)